MEMKIQLTQIYEKAVPRGGVKALSVYIEKPQIT